ncbi:beta-lactamase family protein [Aquiflexum lacus]|uniref:beta-lactamase family protein n=1 Tax=Aquiflexum lacus TaxID=2483805 RepID=UPI001E48E979|nr:beta-lactamase family protein [Aquiflexum lacus]
MGKIIEEVSEYSIPEIMKAYIFDPLGLKNTYVYQDASDNIPNPFFWFQETLATQIHGIAPISTIIPFIYKAPYVISSKPPQEI